MSYWYLERNDSPTEKPLPDFEKSEGRVLKIAKNIKVARQIGRFPCPKRGGCRYCRPLEAVLAGEAEMVGVNDFRQDIFVLKKKPRSEESIII